jgi:hypothetical protein
VRPAFIVLPCPWCRIGGHWLVKPNVLTDRPIAAVAAYTSEAEARAHAARLNALTGNGLAGLKKLEAPDGKA